MSFLLGLKTERETKSSNRRAARAGKPKGTHLSHSRSKDIEMELSRPVTIKMGLLERTQNFLRGP